MVFGVLLYNLATRFELDSNGKAVRVYVSRCLDWSESQRTVMQGFNKYYPPDYDPEKHKSLNSYHGKHALGDRARKIDKGILIVRFELPFNIWCLNCKNHIGMGVRYNAEKKKIGNYFSTPIFSFRCKCHLCDNWFEIHTDPKNTRYVVVSGAKQKDEDWDPAENGGFAVHETNPNLATTSADPFASVEKTTTAELNVAKVMEPRLSSLQELSERNSADPYTLSSKLRRKFRAEKKEDRAKQEEETSVRNRYALPEELKLVPEDEVREEASRGWQERRKDWESEEGGKRLRLANDLNDGDDPDETPSLSHTSRMRAKPKASAIGLSGASTTLRRTILANTARKRDPFQAGSSVGAFTRPKVVGVIVRR